MFDPSRRPDPVALACFGVAALTYALQGFSAALSRDTAIYLYGAQRFAEGSLPYVDIVNRAGPLAHAIPGVGVVAGRLVDVDDVTAVRVLFLLLSALTVSAVYVLGRDLFRSRLAGLVSAACLLAFEAFSFFATFGPREKTAMVLFTTCALVAATRRHWLAAGVWIALATLTWQPVFFPAMAAMAAAIVLAGPARSWWRAGVRLAVGGAIPAAITVLVYGVAGELRVLLDSFVLINARYTRQSSPLGDLSRSWDNTVVGYGWSVWLLLAGLVGALALAVLALARPSATTGDRAGVVAVGVFVLGAVAWTLRAYNYWPDTMLMLPAAAMGVGGLAGLVVRRLSGRVALGMTMVLTAAAVATAATYAVQHRYTGLDRQRAVVEAAIDAIPGARILAIDAPQPLVLTGTENISRFHSYDNGMLRYIDATSPGGVAGYREQLRAQAPTLIAIDGDRPWSRSLLDGYVQVSEDAWWSWWVSDRVPAEQRDTIVAAIEAADERYGSTRTW